jgi:hypothetical protein
MLCVWCGRPFAVSTGRGRPRRFCKQSCRQRDYEARRRASELGLAEGELVVTRDELEQLRDGLYILQAALEDVDRDLAEHGDDPEDRERAFAWLRQAAREALGNAPT